MSGLRSINYYVEGRAFEWSMGLATLPSGLIFIFWPQAVEGSAFTILTGFITPEALGFLMTIVGWSRCASLMLNGQRMFGAKVGPYVRAVCGVISAALWVQFVFALIQASVSRGYPSPGIFFWTMFTIAELYTAYTTVKNG